MTGSSSTAGVLVAIPHHDVAKMFHLISRLKINAKRLHKIDVDAVAIAKEPAYATQKLDEIAQVCQHEETLDIATKLRELLVTFASNGSRSGGLNGVVGDPSTVPAVTVVVRGRPEDALHAIGGDPSSAHEGRDYRFGARGGKVFARTRGRKNEE